MQRTYRGNAHRASHALCRQIIAFSTRKQTRSFSSIHVRLHYFFTDVEEKVANANAIRLPHFSQLGWVDRICRQVGRQVASQLAGQVGRQIGGCVYVTTGREYFHCQSAAGSIREGQEEDQAQTRTTRTVRVKWMEVYRCSTVPLFRLSLPTPQRTFGHRRVTQQTSSIQIVLVTEFCQ